MMMGFWTILRTRIKIIRLIRLSVRRNRSSRALQRNRLHLVRTLSSSRKLINLVTAATKRTTIPHFWFKTKEQKASSQNKPQIRRKRGVRKIRIILIRMFDLEAAILMTLAMLLRTFNKLTSRITRKLRRLTKLRRWSPQKSSNLPRIKRFKRSRHFQPRDNLKLCPKRKSLTRLNCKIR